MRKVSCSWLCCTAALLTGMLAGRLQAAEPAPAAAAVKQIDLPLKTWVPRPIVAGCFEHGKHARLAYNSKNGRIYLTGGDRDESDGGNGSVLSYSIAGGDWRKECPISGAKGDPVPALPDNVVWTYDSARDRFYIMPGYFFGVAAFKKTCPLSEAIPQHTALIFNPNTKRWSWPPFPAPARGYGGDLEAKYGVYDPATDSLYRANESCMQVLNLKTNTWSEVSFEAHSPLRELHINQDQAAIDVIGRQIYYVDAKLKALVCYHIDTKTPKIVGPLPSTYTYCGEWMERSNTVFDPNNRVLLMPNMESFDGEILRLYIYRADTGTWETEEIPNKGLADGKHAVRGNTTVFDPAQNALLLIGGKARGNGVEGLSRLDPTRMTTELPEVFWLYRYGKGTPKKENLHEEK